MDEGAQIFVDVTPIGVEALGDVLESLEEAVEVHLSVLTPPHHVLVDDVVVGLADVRIRHVFEFGQSLELV